MISCNWTYYRVPSTNVKQNHDGTECNVLSMTFWLCKSYNPHIYSHKWAEEGWVWFIRWINKWLGGVNYVMASFITFSFLSPCKISFFLETLDYKTNSCYLGCVSYDNYYISSKWLERAICFSIFRLSMLLSVAFCKLQEHD